MDRSAPPDVVGDDRQRHAPDPRAAESHDDLAAADRRAGRVCHDLLIARQPGRIVDIFDPLGGAAIAAQLRLDPIDRGPIAVGALLPVAVLAEPPERGLVALQIEPPDQHPLRIVVWSNRRLLAVCRRRSPDGEPAQPDRKFVCVHFVPSLPIGLCAKDGTAGQPRIGSGGYSITSVARRRFCLSGRSGKGGRAR